MLQNSDRQFCTVRNLVDKVTTMAVQYHHRWWPTGAPHSWREVSHARNMDPSWPELCKFQTLSIGSVTLNLLKTFMFIVLYSLSAGWNQWKDSCQKNLWLWCWFLQYVFWTVQTDSVLLISTFIYSGFTVLNMHLCWVRGIIRFEGAFIKCWYNIK